MLVAAVSLRGFSQNAAGPRDPETGYQKLGGAGALINNTELPLPPPKGPWLGNTVSFVVLHDMGNVLTNAGDAWASALRVRQPEGGGSVTRSHPRVRLPSGLHAYRPPPPHRHAGTVQL